MEVLKMSDELIIKIVIIIVELIIELSK